jgi:hypothetical protein
VALHGIDLVAGNMHSLRFSDILVKALDIDPRIIRRVPIHDIYGTPATQFRKKEMAPVALAKELAAIALNRLVLKNVRPGNLEDLFDAEEHFNRIAAKDD